MALISVLFASSLALFGPAAAVAATPSAGPVAPSLRAKDPLIDFYLQEARSSDWRRREATVEKLKDAYAREDAAAVVSAMERLLEAEEHYPVSLYALQAVGRQAKGAAAAQAVGVLVKHFENAEPELAVEAIRQASDNAKDLKGDARSQLVGELLKVLDGPADGENIDKHSEALLGLRNFGGDARVEPALKKALADSDWRKSAQAAHTLALLGSGQDLGPLTADLAAKAKGGVADEDRVRAVWLLQRIAATSKGKISEQAAAGIEAVLEDEKVGDYAYGALQKAQKKELH